MREIKKINFLSGFNNSCWYLQGDYKFELN